MEGPCECGSFKIPFGKYKGDRIMDIYDEEPGYIDWCLVNLSEGPFLWAVRAFLEET